MPLRSVTPSTDEPLETRERTSSEEVREPSRAAAAAWTGWRRPPLGGRVEPLRRVAARHREDQPWSSEAPTPADDLELDPAAVARPTDGGRNCMAAQRSRELVNVKTAYVA